jgi:hypothetical protein
MPDDNETPDSKSDGLAESEASAERRTKTKWDRADVLLRAFATPLTVALIGYLTSSYLNKQQMADTNYRAFAQLVSQREDADTNLRKDMFKTVLESFLKPANPQVDDMLLKLEILAYNFHESLDLGPVFQDVLRNIHTDTKTGRDQLDRLQKVASEVIFKQVEALKTDVGVGADAVVDFDALRKDPNLNFIDHVLTMHFSGKREAAEHPTRRFQVQVLSLNQDRKELHVRLIVSKPGQTDPGIEQEVDVPFRLGFFSFPEINNTRLSNGERCAVVLTRMQEQSADISLVYFPANRASLKDRMYVEELLHEMLHVPRD